MVEVEKDCGVPGHSERILRSLQQPTDGRKCRYCGFDKIRADWIYCGGCGRKLDRDGSLPLQT